jgi:filamentous hemagglutinin family protein
MALNNMRQTPFKPTVIAVALAAMLAGGRCAMADPVGPQVRGGAATVTGLGTGAVTVTSTTPTALIQWQSFQVGVGQSVNFVLPNVPNAASTLLNQITGTAAFQGTVTPAAQVMFMQNGNVSGGGLTRFDLGNSVFAALKLNRSAASRAEERREGLAREIVARLAEGQVVALAQARDDVSTSAAGEVLVAAGHSVELADMNNPSLRVLIRAPAGAALNVSQLLARARSTGVFGAMLAQPRPTQRTDAEPARQLAATPEGRGDRDALDTLLAYLDGQAGRIALLADPAADSPAIALAAPPADVPASLQVASLAPSGVAQVQVIAAGIVTPAPASAQDVELMESRVRSWQLATAVAPAPAPAPADIELMESRVASWQLAVAVVSAPQPADTELMEARVTSWQMAVAPVAVPAPADIELMESRVASWQVAAVAAPVTDMELMEAQVTSWQSAVAPVAVAVPADTELMETQVTSWQLAAVAPATPQAMDTELMESRVTSWQLAVAPAAVAVPADTELMEARVTSWQLAAAPAAQATDTELMESRVSSWQLASAHVAVAMPEQAVIEKHVQIAAALPGEAPRVTLPEHRTVQPRLIRIEFKGSSFFM